MSPTASASEHLSESRAQVADASYVAIMEEAMALHRGGRTEEAACGYRRALALGPQRPEAWHLLGTALGQLERGRDAVEALERTVALQPEKGLFHCSLADALKAEGRFPEAVLRYEQALAASPELMQAYDGLGRILWEQRRFEEAARVCQHALKRNPDHTAAYLNLAMVLNDLGRAPEALQCIREALRRDGRCLAAWNALGDQLRRLNRLSEALAACQQALQVAPDFVEAVANAGLVLQQLGHPDKAQLCFQSAVARRPTMDKTHSALLFNMLYLTGFDPARLLIEAGRWWELHGKPVASVSPQSSGWSTDPRKRLRIGYVSPDLRKHSVSYFLLPLLEARNRQALEVFCYAEVNRPDEVTRRIESLSDGWRFTSGLSDEALARRIGQDRIDILVDLAGHTRGNRLLAFARRPAPVQVTWLGYAATTGLPVMDWRITDEQADPAGASERFHSERLLRLPWGFLCYRPDPAAPPVGDPPLAAGGGLTFGSFNTLPKINPALIALWSEILKRVPDARLLLKCKQLADGGVRARYGEMFRQQGIDAGRVTMHGHRDTTAGHLQMYGQIDIALDTFPYNGTTTTCEALWMGVPVVTLAGGHHASRVGASVLKRVGLDDLCVTSDPEGYIAAAVSLAGDRTRLARLRREMRERVSASALCDAAGFAAAMEDALRRVWIQWCARSG